MSVIPANAVVVPDGHLVVAIPEHLADGEWRFCAAYRIVREGDGAHFELATEADLEEITGGGS